MNAPDLEQALLRLSLAEQQIEILRTCTHILARELEALALHLPDRQMYVCPADGFVFAARGTLYRPPAACPHCGYNPMSGDPLVVGADVPADVRDQVGI